MTDAGQPKSGGHAQPSHGRMWLLPDVTCVARGTILELQRRGRVVQLDGLSDPYRFARHLVGEDGYIRTDRVPEVLVNHLWTLGWLVRGRGRAVRGLAPFAGGAA